MTTLADLPRRTQIISPTLTLCIPTFQRPQCLATLLESVAVQSPGFSEVVVSDDCSHDDTSDVVDRFTSRIPNLLYRRCSSNVGLDENFRIALDLASSDYVWFMGDDDRLRPGAVAAFQSSLRNFPDVLGITFASVDYDSTLQKPTGLKFVPPTQLVTGAETLFSRYVDLLGFMSTTVVQRRAWNEVPAESIGAFDNLYSQVHRIGMMVGADGQWLLSSDLTVDYRSDNDQFKSRSGGEYQRMLRDVNAYEAIIKDLFADTPTIAFAAKDRVLRTHIISRVRNGKLASRYPSVAAAKSLALVYASHLFYWTRVVPTLIAPARLLRMVRAAFRAVSPTSGALRARAFEETLSG